MLGSELIISDLPLPAVPALADFAPEGWQTRLDEVLLTHFGKPWFRARIGQVEGCIAAVGQVIRHGRAGWLGNIIVTAAMRSRGFGTRMTKDLIDLLEAAGAKSLLLVATELGRPVYHKLGFRTVGDYVFMKPGAPIPSPDVKAIRRAEPGDVAAVLRIDAAATGEERSAFLAPVLPTGWVHQGPRGEVDGLFLPALGSGFIAAESLEAGSSLLQFKHFFYGGSAVVPAANAEAVELLRRLGFVETSRAPRMALGEDVAWNPSMIFARGAGYCG